MSGTVCATAGSRLRPFRMTPALPYIPASLCMCSRARSSKRCCEGKHLANWGWPCMSGSSFDAIWQAQRCKVGRFRGRCVSVRYSPAGHAAWEEVKRAGSIGQGAGQAGHARQLRVNAVQQCLLESGCRIAVHIRHAPNRTRHLQHQQVGCIKLNVVRHLPAVA